MSIKRYVANKDATITNAFKYNLTTRATNSNMGASDILEVFSLYGQATTSSLESSRILLQFPIEQIISDRNSGKIGLTGNCEFILKLSNAPHGDSTPSNFSLVANALSSSWTEGVGLDMESYADIDVVNWLSSSNTSSWNNEGGDFVGTDYEQYFDTGLEDFEINITDLVESWVINPATNNGVLIRLINSLENSNTSYYTKKFFARGSEFFFKRPWIECRTDDSFSDDRNNFTLSSSLLDSEDNLNTLVLYNRVNGKLKNIPLIGTGSELFVSLYSGTVEPLGNALLLHNNQTKIQAGFYKTGIYTASIAVNTNSEYLFDVWFSGSTAENSSSIVFATGSVIYTKNYEASFDQQETEYVLKLEQLKNVYRTNEQARIKIKAREKDWSPNIYTVASKDIETLTIDDLYYKVVRFQDQLEVIPYGTGSIKYTKTSIDKECNFFDLDMSLLEPGYMYIIKLGYYFGDNFNEFKETFKFRVEK